MADEEGFDTDAFVGHICAGLAVVAAVAAGAAFIVFTGGATAALAPSVKGVLKLGN